MSKKNVGTHTMVMGWDEIASYFPYHRNTVLKRYGREMLEAGFVFKSVVSDIGEPGYKRQWRVWSYEFLILSFISKKQAQQGYI